MNLLRRTLPALAILVIAGCDATGPGGEFPPPEPFVPEADGLPAFPEFPDNPTTREGIELGRRLFHDSILSADRTQSCSSCHDQSFAFSDRGRRFSEGVRGQEGTRNASAIVNVAWSRNLFWDGRARSIEDQARGPVPNRIEMDLPWEEALPRLRDHSEYPGLFGRAFGTREITEDHVVMAIAQFERTIISNDSRWDRSRRGELVLTDAEGRGEELFYSETAECFHCHATTLFTDERFHDNGVDRVYTDEGRFAVTENPADRGKFRTPTLRNVEYTAPYMHDGRFDTLEDVLAHYASGVQPSDNLSPILRSHGPGGLGLTVEQQADLVAFLRALSDEGFLTDPKLGP